MNKETVCFITLPSPFLLDERVFPSLGILKVAACAKQLGYTVHHLDLNGCENYEDVVFNYCMNHSTVYFALSATTPQMVAATKVNKIIHSVSRDMWVIIGGPHPTLTYAAYKSGSQRSNKALAQLLHDYRTVVVGDGELAIERAMNCLGIVDADDPKGELFLKKGQLESLPFPDRSLIDLDTYHYSIDGVRVTPIIGQLGCPFGCNFCAGRDSAMLRRVRLRPTENIIAEMRHLYHTYGIHGFMFFDDELNVNPKVMELLIAMDRLQQELGVELRCRGFVKSELFTEAQGKAMYQAGFRRIMCGFESGSERILKNINKNATIEDNTKAMEISHKYGLDMKALMSLGHPGESPESIYKTMEWLLSVKPADFDCTIITAYPGSPYYDRAINNGAGIWEFTVNDDNLYMQDIDYTEIEDFYKGSIDGYKSYVWTDYLSAEAIVALRDNLERTVRDTLKIPFYTATAATRFESSMGQLPGSIYRES